MTTYKWSETKGYVTSKGRPISPTYRVGLSRTGKTVLVYNSKGRVVGRIANAKKSPLMAIQRDMEGDSRGDKIISYRGITASDWREFQEEHIKVYGYEYH